MASVHAGRCGRRIKIADKQSTRSTGGVHHSTRRTVVIRTSTQSLSTAVKRRRTSTAQALTAKARARCGRIKLVATTATRRSATDPSVKIRAISTGTATSAGSASTTIIAGRFPTSSATAPHNAATAKRGVPPNRTTATSSQRHESPASPLREPRASATPPQTSSLHPESSIQRHNSEPGQPSRKRTDRESEGSERIPSVISRRPSADVKGRCGERQEEDCYAPSLAHGPRHDQRSDETDHEQYSEDLEPVQGQSFQPLESTPEWDISPGPCPRSVGCPATRRPISARRATTNATVARRMQGLIGASCGRSNHAIALIANAKATTKTLAAHPASLQAAFVSSLTPRFCSYQCAAYSFISVDGVKSSLDGSCRVAQCSERTPPLLVG